MLSLAKLQMVVFQFLFCFKQKFFGWFIWFCLNIKTLTNSFAILTSDSVSWLHTSAKYVLEGDFSIRWEFVKTNIDV